MPSGSLGAQPELWLNVALTDPDGKRIWESGYVDSNGDMPDLHSLDVAVGTIDHDDLLHCIVGTPVPATAIDERHVEHREEIRARRTTADLEGASALPVRVRP